MVEIKKTGMVVSSGKNLRILLDYARNKSAPETANIIWAKDYGAILYVSFSDSAVGFCHFADHTLAKRWIEGRKSWGAAVKTVAGKMIIYQW